MGFRYVIVEVDGKIAPADAAAITELELLDKSGQKIAYTVMSKAYEKSNPNYWSTSSNAQWGPLNLSNGDLKYGGSSEGASSSTVFMFMTDVAFSRFALDLGSAKDIETVNVWAGNPQKRIPKNIKFYGANEYTYETHLEGRSNAGLFSLCNFSFNGSELTVTKYTTAARKEKYFVMNELTNGVWSPNMHTMANRITMKQDVIVTSMEWYVHGASGPSNTGTAKIWDANGLLAKGNTITVNEKGLWVRSTFNSPVYLKKDNPYYVGFSATGIGIASSAARDIQSNDGSLLMTTASTGYRREESGETDERPNYGISQEFSIRLYVEINNTRFLIDSDGTIKKISGSWTDVGLAPVTDQMFSNHGMASLDDITAEQWKALPKNSKILAYTEGDKTFKATISRNMLYNSEDKLYRGTGIIETVAEELPSYRRTLMITAEHQECTFQYSLDSGTTWTDFQSGDVIDVSKKTGKQLKIRTNLPTDSATLTAISYAWA